MADLFICHTAYQVLIALVRALRAGGADFVRFRRVSSGFLIDSMISQVRTKQGLQ